MTRQVDDLQVLQMTDCGPGDEFYYVHEFGDVYCSSLSYDFDGYSMNDDYSMNDGYSMNDFECGCSMNDGCSSNGCGYGRGGDHPDKKI